MKNLNDKEVVELVKNNTKYEIKTTSQDILRAYQTAVNRIRESDFGELKVRNVKLSEGEVTVILHKHQVSDPYRAHGRSRTMKRAIRDIKKHDLFQMNGRKPVYKG